MTGAYDFRDFQDNKSHNEIRSNLLTAALDWRMSSRLQTGVRREQNLGSSDPTYPNQTLVTAGYRINDFTRLFFTQRLASSPIVPIGDLSHTGFASLMSKTETRIGIETRLKRTLSLTTRYQLENGMNGIDSFAVLGQNWGFPTYDWPSTARDGYAWWASRRRRADPLDQIEHGLLAHLHQARLRPVDAISRRCAGGRCQWEAG